VIVPSDRVRCTPDRVRCTPDRAGVTPDRVRCTPDRVGVTPDRVRCTPDRAGVHHSTISQILKEGHCTRTIAGDILQESLLKHNLIFDSVRVFEEDSIIMFTMLWKELGPFYNMSIYLLD
jgi:hypothetical protein